MPAATCAAFAIAMFRNLDAQCKSAQMSDLTKKIHGGFGVATLEFAVGWAHAAELLEAAVRAEGLAGIPAGADFL